MASKPEEEIKSEEGELLKLPEKVKRAYRGLSARAEDVKRVAKDCRLDSKHGGVFDYVMDLSGWLSMVYDEAENARKNMEISPKDHSQIISIAGKKVDKTLNETVEILRKECQCRLR